MSSGNPCIQVRLLVRSEPLVYLGYWFTLLVIASQFTLHVPFILFPSHHEGGVTTWWPHDSPVYPTWSAQPHRGMGSDPRGV